MKNRMTVSRLSSSCRSRGYSEEEQRSWGGAGTWEHGSCARTHDSSTCAWQCVHVAVLLSGRLGHPWLHFCNATPCLTCMPRNAREMAFNISSILSLRRQVEMARCSLQDDHTWLLCRAFCSWHERGTAGG